MMGRLPSDRLVDLYNGPLAVAERAEDGWLEYLHVATSLEEHVEDWIAEKYDVVLTGNSGDGKTHLINVLGQRGVLGVVHAEKDASQRGTQTLLETWNQKKLAGVPYLLAINHAPLRQLAAEARTYQRLHYLVDLPREIENTIFYNKVLDSGPASVIVLDLGQRELLTTEIVEGLAYKMCSLVTSSQCTACPPGRCPVEYNAKALSNKKVLGNLIALLSLVARRGFHATMRDLTGLLAYILTGGKRCVDRWKPDDGTSGSIPSFNDYTYYNLLFTGRGNLFQAVQSTFDPATFAEPQSDLELWAGRVTSGWLIPERTGLSPATLRDLQVLKRRYFFEHDHVTAELLKRMLSVSESAFNALLKGEVDHRSAVEDIILMINTFYAPLVADQQSDHRSRLRLWNHHRYSAGGATGYMSMHSISSEALTLYWPRVAPKLAGALNVRQDHVLLGAHGWRPGDVGLLIDWPMYKALADARNGTPVDVQPFHILRRLDSFLRNLSSSSDTRQVETIEWYDRRRRSQELVRVNRSNQRYV